MSAAYWRVRVSQANGPDVWFAEVQFLDETGAAISLASGSPISGGDYSAAYGKALAFDGVVDDSNNGWSSSTVPAWIGWMFPTPTQVFGAKVFLSTHATAYDELPLAGYVFLESSDDGIIWNDTGLKFAGNYVVGGVLTTTYVGSPLAVVIEQGGWVQGRGYIQFTQTILIDGPGSVQQDYRHIRPTTGSISDKVVVKSGATETPYIDGRVWLLRLADGYKAWEGWSDSSGNYTATGLELGVEYVAVAIDPLRNFKTTGAGPVTAA